MRINNYRGTVADRPIDAVVVEPEGTYVPQQLPAQKSSFMDKILSQKNNQSNLVPAGNLPVYNKG